MSSVTGPSATSGGDVIEEAATLTAAAMEPGLDPREPTSFRRSRRRPPFRLIFGGVVLALIVLGILFAPLLTHYSPTRGNLSQSLKSPFSPGHLLGTDSNGRDVLARLLYGGRYTVGITLFSTTVGALVGVALGAVAAFFRGAVDVIIMRTTDALLAFPSILIAFVVVAILGSGTNSVVWAMMIYAAPIFIRFAYTATLPLMSHDLVEASRARGASNLRIIYRHIIPNILPEIIILWTLRLAVVAILVSSLSYVGLGVTPPRPEWGAMLGQGAEYLTYAPALVVVPGIAISILIISFNLIGDGLRDYLDPRSRK